MKKLISLFAKLCVFILVSGFSFLTFVLIIGSSEAPDPESLLATIQMLSAFVVPILLGALVTWKVFKPESKSSEREIQNANAEIDDLLTKENSAFSILKEELSRWNWQLVVGSLIFGWGFMRIIPNFFFGIVLIVLGLSILSIGGTKYREKQEMQERELRRRLYAVVEKRTSDHKGQSTPNVSTGNVKCKTYKVAGVAHYAENIEELGVENENYFKTKRELMDEDLIDERIWKYHFYPGKVDLVPEPENLHDPDAIKVVVDDTHVGYIKHGSCAHVLKLLKEESVIEIDCTIGGGPYKIVFQEYDEEREKEVCVQEKDERPFFVHLQIKEK